MMNNDMLQNLEYLREKADVSYEEAVRLLEQFDGNVMAAIVELERRGCLFSQEVPGSARPCDAASWQKDIRSAKGKASSLFQKMRRTRVVVSKKHENSETETIANVNALIAIGAVLFAPYITLSAAAIGLVLGCKVKVERFEIET